MRRWERPDSVFDDGLDWYRTPAPPLAGTLLVLFVLACAVFALCVVWP